jgi:hypothetical protein
MNTLTQFVRTTILGGMFFIIPIVAPAILLAKALEYANKALSALATHNLAASKLSAAGATVTPVVVIALVCFFASPLRAHLNRAGAGQGA